MATTLPGEPSPSDAEVYVTWVLRAKPFGQFFIDRLGLPQKESDRFTKGRPSFKDDDAKSCTGLYQATQVSLKKLRESYPNEYDVTIPSAGYQKLIDEITEPLLEQYGRAIWSDSEPCMTQVGEPEYPKQFLYNDPEDREVLKVLLFSWIISRFIKNPIKTPTKNLHVGSVPAMARSVEQIKIPRTGQPFRTSHDARPHAVDICRIKRYPRHISESDSESDLGTVINAPPRPGTLKPVTQPPNGGPTGRAPEAVMYQEGWDISHSSGRDSVAVRDNSMGSSDQSSGRLVRAGARETGSARGESPRGIKRRDISTPLPQASNKHQRRDVDVYKNADIDLRSAAEYLSTPPLSATERPSTGRPQTHHSGETNDEPSRAPIAGSLDGTDPVTFGRDKKDNLDSVQDDLHESRCEPRSNILQSLNNECNAQLSRCANANEQGNGNETTPACRRQSSSGTQANIPSPTISTPEERSNSSTIAAEPELEPSARDTVSAASGLKAVSTSARKVAKGKMSVVDEKVQAQRQDFALNVLQVLSETEFSRSLAKVLQETTRLASLLIDADAPRLKGIWEAEYERYARILKAWSDWLGKLITFLEITEFEYDKTKRKVMLESVTGKERLRVMRKRLEVAVATRPLRQETGFDLAALPPCLATIFNAMADWLGVGLIPEREIAEHLEGLNQSLLSWTE